MPCEPRCEEPGDSVPVPPSLQLVIGYPSNLPREFQRFSFGNNFGAPGGDMSCAPRCEEPGDSLAVPPEARARRRSRVALADVSERLSDRSPLVARDACT